MTTATTRATPSSTTASAVLSLAALPPGEYLVYCAIDGETESLFVAATDGRRLGRLLRNVCEAAISPSGRYLSITDAIHNREGPIIIHDLTTGRNWAVAFSEGCLSPSRSPDEAWIAAICEAEANLHALSVWSQQDVLLVDCFDTWNTICGTPHWSPDGRTIAYERFSPPDPPQGVYLVDAVCVGSPGCRPTERFLGFFSGWYEWSPDGARIAGWYVPSEGEPRFEVIDVATGAITPLEVAAGLGPGNLAWSPSGEYLAVESFPLAGIGDLWLLPLGGGPGVSLGVEPYGGALFWLRLTG